MTARETGPDVEAARPTARPLEWRERLIADAGTVAVRALGATWRFRRVEPDPVVTPFGDGQPRLYAFWHSQILAMLALHRHIDLAVLVSAHRDGEMIARVARRFGLRTIRGSTSRGAVGALRAMDRAVAQGSSVVVTPDGPRGPAEVFAPGVLIAAQRASVPIVVGAAVPRRAWRLASWDRFVIPKPFTRIVVAYSEAFRVTADSPRGAVAEAADFQRRLAAVNATAQAEH